MHTFHNSVQVPQASAVQLGREVSTEGISEMKAACPWPPKKKPKKLLGVAVAEAVPLEEAKCSNVPEDDAPAASPPDADLPEGEKVDSDSQNEESDSQNEEPSSSESEDAGLPHSEMQIKGWRCTYRKIRPEKPSLPKMKQRLAQKFTIFGELLQRLPASARASATFYKKGAKPARQKRFLAAMAAKRKGHHRQAT